MIKTIVSLLVILACSGGPALAAELPSVVVSIKPIHALVAGVMQGVSEPTLLVKGGGSPHDYYLRPSEARMITKADLVVWIGPQLESFLEKPLNTLGKKAHQLKLLESIDGPLLRLREGGTWEEHHHDHEADHHDHEADHHDHEADHHDHENDVHADEVNPHIWLNPLLAKQVVSRIAQVLGELDPAHRQRYQGNATRLHARLDKLHMALTKRLIPVKGVPYIVFHDAYHYFEKAYGLNAAGSISVNPERGPGARRIAEIRAKIKTLKARCVFSEPQFESRLVQTVIEGTGARTGILDPLGAEIPAGENSYFILLNNLADNLITGVR